MSKLKEAWNTYNAEISSRNWYITIDPGARSNGGTGLAFWHKNEPEPILVKYINCKLGNYEQRVNFITTQMENFAQEIVKNLSIAIGAKDFSPLPINYTINRFSYSQNKIPVFIERPKYFDSSKGELAAKSDSLFKLIFCYGCIYQFWMQTGITYSVPLQIAHWKGQLNDRQVKTRVNDRCNYIPTKDNDQADVYAALGMGFWLKGTF